MAPTHKLTLGRWLRLREAYVRSIALDRSARALAALRYSMPDADPAHFGLRFVRDVVYGPSGRREHRLDVYMPAPVTGPLPVVMYVHGGGFGMLSKETHRVMALAFARRGYLTFNINYRQGLYEQYPAPLEDATTALLWVARHAADYGGDPGRIVVGGESAGGNLVVALALAHAKRYAEPFARRLFDANLPLRAVVSTYPFLDMRDAHVYMRHPKLAPWMKWLVFDAAASYVGDRVYGDDHHNLASPLELLETGYVPDRRLPAFFLSCGTRDPLLGNSKRLKSALDRLGADSELLIAPGEIHGYDAMVWRKAAKEKWRRVDRFLDRTVRGSGTPGRMNAAKDASEAPGNGRGKPSEGA